MQLFKFYLTVTLQNDVERSPQRRLTYPDLWRRLQPYLLKIEVQGGGFNLHLTIPKKFGKNRAEIFENFNNSLASSGVSESSITICIAERELACFIYLCHHPLHWKRLQTRVLFIGPCHCSYIFVPCLPFRVPAAGNLNKTILFVVDVLGAWLWLID